MIVVDTSVWIDYWRLIDTPKTARLDALLGRQRILMGDLILCELLQAVCDEREANTLLDTLSHLPFATMVGRELAVQAALYCRKLRHHGITIRKTVDLLIATFCLARGHSLLHDDRDFVPFIRHFGLPEA